MSSRLVVDQIQDSAAQTIDTTVLRRGSTKAWIDLNDAHDTILNSYNVSSLTDTATGDATGNFTSALASANYAAGASIRESSPTNRTCHINSSSTTTIQMVAGLTASNSKQNYRSNYIVAGDLA